MNVLRSVVAGLVLGVGAGVFAAEPSIEGSYVLEYRELPDGKQVRPPEIVGMLTFTRDHRNFNVYWSEAGKPVSISAVSTYKLTAAEYTEDNVYYLENGVAGRGPTYDLAAQSGKSPVSVNGEKISVQLPLHGEPKAVFDGSGMTATREGAFVDHWKKAK